MKFKIEILTATVPNFDPSVKMDVPLGTPLLHSALFGISIHKSDRNIAYCTTPSRKDDVQNSSVLLRPISSRPMQSDGGHCTSVVRQSIV